MCVSVSSLFYLHVFGFNANAYSSQKSIVISVLLLLFWIFHFKFLFTLHFFENNSLLLFDLGNFYRDEWEYAIQQQKHWMFVWNGITINVMGLFLGLLCSKMYIDIESSIYRTKFDRERSKIVHRFVYVISKIRYWMCESECDAAATKNLLFGRLKMIQLLMLIFPVLFFVIKFCWLNVALTHPATSQAIGNFKCRLYIYTFKKRNLCLIFVLKSAEFFVICLV